MSTTCSAPWSFLIVPVIGASLSMAAAAGVGFLVPPGIGRVAASWLVGALGLALTAFVYWRTSGESAGDPRRAEVVAVLAFVAAYDQAWIGLLALESRHAKITADFAMTCGAFIFAMFVYLKLPSNEASTASDAPKDGTTGPSPERTP
jgi:hypothetical protein